ncbi:molecular chaperone HtpG, partial [Streptomyces sp. SID10244]|nr:molecular chaperone HtpG [Streptomyces sp. SID10244]
DDETDTEKAKADKEKRTEEFTGLLDWLAETLTDDVNEARLSSRLTESAACLVGDTFSMSPQLEKLYRASGQELPKTKRALEINADHPLIAGLNDAFRASDNHTPLVATAKLIYGMAVIAEGGELGDPAEFAKLLAGTLTDSLATES